MAGIKKLSELPIDDDFTGAEWFIVTDYNGESKRLPGTSLQEYIGDVTASGILTISGISLDGYIKTDGTVPMDGGYLPSGDQDLVTKSYMAANTVPTLSGVSALDYWVEAKEGVATKLLPLDDDANILIGSITNTISGTQTRSVIVGGGDNATDSDYSSIAGGYQNIITDSEYTFIGGGYNNSITVSGNYSTIAGGSNNTTDSEYTFIGAGWSNTITGDYASIGGGKNNQILAGGDFTGWGIELGSFDTIAGGLNNTISGVSYSNFIGGGGDFGNGSQNLISNGMFCNILGGSECQIVGDSNGGVYSSSIAGGADNQIFSSDTIYSDYSFIGAGSSNIIKSSSSSIVGGRENTTNGRYSSIVGGKDNTTNGLNSFIGAGWDNTATGDYSGIAGGRQNTANSRSSFIGGGYANITNDDWTFVGGGYTNTTNGIYSGIGAGFYNTANGDYSSIAGGRENVTNGDNSCIAGGYGAVTSIYGQQSFASGIFNPGQYNLHGNAQTSKLVLRTSTDSASGTVLATDGGIASSGNQLVLQDNQDISFIGTVTAREQNGTEHGSWKIEGIITRNTGAATTVLLASTVTEIYNSSGLWGISLGADTTNGALSITFTGEAATNIRVVCALDTSEVIY